MKQSVFQNKNYCIYKVDKESLSDMTEFVVKENYKHHIVSKSVENMKKDIETVYQEELSFTDRSQIYIAENENKRMIGCIRVMRWNQTDTLPIQKIFNINPLDYINGSSLSSYWHVGRFAIDSCAGIPNLSLFKQLMMYAIHPIYQEQDGYMIAECDSKLLRVMNLLGIDTVRLSNGVHYLGSETIPVYVDKKGLKKFYDKHFQVVSFPAISA
jgi:hypothetical protein